ncbi:radical SAM protein [Novosphingobium sp. BL-52-GroH]|uniref:radical SAM protein n=1 Tax=Novosphingobium sp. BL-52-GroH TaxID=3349877 RepID=UPI003850BF7C
MPLEYLEELAFVRSSASSMFNGRQLKELQSYEDRQELTRNAGDYPSRLFLIIKATRLCNLRCSYCRAWREGRDQVLAFSHLLSVIAQAMRLPGIRDLHIVWHGGETTLLSRRYFERAIWLQEHFRIDDRKVGHAIQSNATRIDEHWARFFRATGFSVGVSLDVDAESHDRSRQFPGGVGSYAATKAGLEALAAAGVPHGLLAVIDASMIKAGAASLLENLSAHGVRSVGLLNALPSNESVDGQSYLDWESYVSFLRQVFAKWHSNPGNLSLRELESLFNIVKGSGSRLCIYQGGCMGQYLTIEPDGRVSACDKYVGDPTHHFGDLCSESLFSILTVSAGLKRAREEAAEVLKRFSGCANFAYCRGGCPHDARLNTRFGNPGAQCCGLSPLIDDMHHAASKERDNGRDYDRSRRIREAEVG